MGGSEKLYRTCVSAFAAILLLAQISTIPFTAYKPAILMAKIYPIIEYPMYGPAHYENERVNALWVISGETADGQIMDLPREMIGLRIFDFIPLLNHVVKRDDPKAQVSLANMVRKNVPGGSDIVKIHVSNYPLKVTKNGPEEMPSERVKTLDVEALLGGES